MIEIIYRDEDTAWVTVDGCMPRETAELILEYFEQLKRQPDGKPK